MYKYDKYDQAIVDARVEEFRDQVRRRLAGELTEDQFKPLRLKNGLYLQLHAYMLRVAIPYGTLDSRADAHARRTSRASTTAATAISPRGRTSSTTGSSSRRRPTSSPIWPTVEMHAIQTSGELHPQHLRRPVRRRRRRRDRPIRARGPSCSGRWTTFHPEFSYLPRKFKIAVIAADDDRAAMRLHDIGAADRRERRRRARLRGLCRRRHGPHADHRAARSATSSPTDRSCSATSRRCCASRTATARRDNIHKARIKILVHELGEDEFRRQVEEEFAHFLTLGIDPPAGRVRPHRRLFRAAAVRDRPAATRSTARDPDFALWVDQKVARAQGAGLRDRQHQPQADRRHPRRRHRPSRSTSMADLAERYSFDELRVDARAEHRPAARPQGDLYAVWQALDDGRARRGQSRPDQRHHRLPGPRLLQPRQRPLDPGRAEDRRALRRSRRASATSASSSSRSRAASTPAATTTPGNIGILGVDRKGTENYQLLLGGSGAEDASLGQDHRPRLRRGRHRRRGRDARSSSYRAIREPTASASSTPTAASAWMPSRRRSMGEPITPALPRRCRRTTSPRSRSTRSSTRPTPTAVRLEAGDDVRRAAPVPRPACAGRGRLPQVPRRARLSRPRGSCARRATPARSRAHRRRAGRPDRPSCAAAASTASRPTRRSTTPTLRGGARRAIRHVYQHAADGRGAGLEAAAWLKRARSRPHRHRPALHRRPTPTRSTRASRASTRATMLRALFAEGTLGARRGGLVVRHRERGAAAPRRAGRPDGAGDLRRHAEDVPRDARLSRRRSSSGSASPILRVDPARSGGARGARTRTACAGRTIPTAAAKSARSSRSQARQAGVRRVDHRAARRSSRSPAQNLPRFEIEDGRLKVNPLGDWTKDDLDAYFAEHDLPRHPLEAQGYLSIGCAPCTSTVAARRRPARGPLARLGQDRMRHPPADPAW